MMGREESGQMVNPPSLKSKQASRKTVKTYLSVLMLLIAPGGLLAIYMYDLHKPTARVRTPVIISRSGMAEAEEGCLSLPEVYGNISRPEKVVVEAYDLEGRQFRRELEDLFARVVQHEIDHLDGVLFIDRLGPSGRLAIKEELQDFELAFAGRRRRGEIPDDDRIAARLAELERLRT